MLLGACSKGQQAEPAPPRELRDADYPGALATTLAGPDLHGAPAPARRGPRREIGGEVVPQKQGDALTLVGLDAVRDQGGSWPSSRAPR